jgi:tyrosyl-tRNA synthetase
MSLEDGYLPMADHHSVKNKMQKGDGMSFAEFSYPILQGWDWWHMYNTLGIRMQIGGADQYGNITAGIDAVKYIAENHPAPDTPKKTSDPPFGFTVPLLTTSAGAKFGKSAGNAIWLDDQLTSTFDLYGYFLRTPDADVARYLKLFTFMKIEDIDELVKEHMESPSQRLAQHKLASEFVELIHGKQAAKHAEEQHRLVFQGRSIIPAEDEKPDLAGIGALGLEHIHVNNRPKAQMKLPRSLIETKSIGKILFAAGLAESASEGHRLAAKQAVYIGGSPTRHKMPMNDGALSFAPIKLWKPEETKTYLIGGNLLILRRGKHNIRIIEVVEDEEYEKSGLEYPGKNVDDTAKITQENQARGEARKLQEQEAESTETAATANDNTWDKIASEVDDPRRPTEKLTRYYPQWADTEEPWERKERNPSQKVGKSDKDIREDESENDEFEGMDPEMRLQKLKDDLDEELAERQRKIDAKSAPKPKFTGHYKIPQKSRMYKDRNSWLRS